MGLRITNGVVRLTLLAASSGLLVVACASTGQQNPPLTSHAPDQITIREIAVPVDGAALAARVAAPSDPIDTIIALHGGPGVASSYMHGLDRLALERIIVVTYDQRGVGESGLPETEFSMAAYVADLAAVQRETAAGPVIVFGHSWGGLLALNYAAAHPERVRALVLFGSAPPTRSALVEAAQEFQQRLEALQQQGIVAQPLPAGGRYLEEIQPVYFSDPTRALPSVLIDLDYEPRVNRATWTTLGNYDFREELRALDHRVLFFWGRDDPFGEGMARATLSALENAEVETVWLDDCGHYWFECPKPFYSQLTAFVEKERTQVSPRWLGLRVELD